MIVSLEKKSDPVGVYIDVALLDDGGVVVEYVDMQGDTEFDSAFAWAARCSASQLPAPPEGWRLRTA